MKTLRNSFHPEAFFSKLQENSLLMLDYDGTLAPFVVNRTQAYPYPEVIRFFKSAHHLKNMKIVIISGRELSELERLLGSASDDLELWGSHGLERKFRNGQRSTFSIDPAIFKGLEKGLKISRSIVAPSQYEIKPFSIAVHWRGLPKSKISPIIDQLLPLWEKLCQYYPLEVHHFDGGLELRPINQGKALPVQILLKEIPPNTTVAYFGDDFTDEEAFQALGDQGLKVLVRKELRPTLADIQLTPPEELLSFLEQWRERYAAKL